MSGNEFESRLANGKYNIKIVTEENQGDSIENIIKRSTAISTITRKQELNANIVDLNIVPINIHALMKSIPLINIYNYEFMLDYMIYNNNNKLKLNQIMEVRDGKHCDYFMIDPYAKTTITKYDPLKLMSEINTLNTNTTLFRNILFINLITSYLKEQLYNKLIISR